MKENERGNRKLRQLPKPCAEKAKDGETPETANQVQALWFDVEGEHRRLYAIRKNEAGKSLFFLDRNEVLEFTGWPNPIPDTLSAADVQTVARMGGQTKGVYLILTRGGGSWGGYLLRRKYQDAERVLIPVESEERDAAAHKRPAGAERHVPGTFWLSDADKAALDAATTPEGKARIMHGAELRGWMTPHEHEAWSTAKTDSDRQDIERKAAAAAEAERQTERQRRKERMQADAARADAEARAAADHKRSVEDAMIGLASAMQGKTGKIVIDGKATALNDYGIGYHSERRDDGTGKDAEHRVKHLWIETARGRFVLSHIVCGESLTPAERPTELTFKKSALHQDESILTDVCTFRTMDAGGREHSRFAYFVQRPHKRATGKRGAPPTHTSTEIQRVEKAIAAARNAGARNPRMAATEALYNVTPDSPDWQKHYDRVKKMHDDARNRKLPCYVGRRPKRK